MSSFKALNTVDNFDPSTISYEVGTRPFGVEPNPFLGLKEMNKGGKSVNKVWTLEDCKLVGIFESKHKAGQYSALFVWEEGPYAKKLAKFFEDQASAINALPEEVKRKVNLYHNADKIRALQKKNKTKTYPSLDEVHEVVSPLYYDDGDGRYKLFTNISVVPFTNPKDNKTYDPVALTYINPKDRKQSKLSLLKLQKMHVQCDYVKISLELVGKATETGMAPMHIIAKCFDIITTHKPTLSSDNSNAELLSAAIDKRLQGGIAVDDEDDNNVDIMSLLDETAANKPVVTMQSLEAPRSANAQSRTMGDDNSDSEGEEPVPVAKTKKVKKSTAVFPQ